MGSPNDPVVLESSDDERWLSLLLLGNQSTVYNLDTLDYISGPIIKNLELHNSTFGITLFDNHLLLDNITVFDAKEGITSLTSKTD